MIRGEIDLPGDKSISHRYAILGGMARGETKITNFSASQDCSATLGCVQALGVEVHRNGRPSPGHQVRIQSEGWRHFRQPDQILDAQNSGTTIRLLSALLASRKFVSTIQGDESLNRRPMKRIIIPLTQMGAEIEAREGEYPPLTIQGNELHGIRYALPIASAQVKSCVLLAGLAAKGQTSVIEKTPSRDHTERALPLFGARFETRNGELTVEGGVELNGTAVSVPGDFSAAVYFILGALLVPGSEVRLRNVGLNPSRTALLDLLEQSGANIRRLNHPEPRGEPVSDLQVHFSPEVLARFPSEIGGEQIPNLIDEIPALAVFGTQLRRGLTVRGAEELRKKESDRIHAIALNLRSVGVEAEEFPDGFHIRPGQSIQGGDVQTFGDHRLAMAFGVARLISSGAIHIDDPDCSAVSFPGFFETLQSVTS